MSLTCARCKGGLVDLPGAIKVRIVGVPARVLSFHAGCYRAELLECDVNGETRRTCPTCRQPWDDVCLDCDRLFCQLCDGACPICGFDTLSACVPGGKVK